MPLSNPSPLNESSRAPGEGRRWRSVVGPAFWKGLRLAFPLGTAFAGIVVAILWHVLEPRYESTSLLAIEAEHRGIRFPDASDEISPDFVRTQVDLLREPFIIRNAIKTGNLTELPELRGLQPDEDPVLWISHRLRVERGEANSLTHDSSNLRLFRVSFIAQRPESAQKVVAAIVKVYTRYHEGEIDVQLQRMVIRLEQERIACERDVELKRIRLRELHRQMGRPDSTGIVSAETEKALRDDAAASRLMRIRERQATEDLGRAEEALQQLQERLMLLSTEYRGLGPVSVVSEARVPKSPISPTPVRRIAIAGAAACALPFVLCPAYFIFIALLRERSRAG